ncbi:hypothetical protein [Clostridium tagluense]|uniref:Uncharacterized protein n=1 Tax=Clostridium tagluense TaxID=360422 RepID=A0A401USF4_9CLOT|nr:hypothetical protein [Clostridium tagluense]GCD12490.1 hypothetical protein Ctaglu_41130 [Clostridium tagluense]
MKAHIDRGSNYDLVIDTSHISMEEVVEDVLDKMRRVSEKV